MKLKTVTITGADDSVSPIDMKEITHLRRGDAGAYHGTHAMVQSIEQHMAARSLTPEE